MRKLTTSDISKGPHSILDHYLITNTTFNITTNMKELSYSPYSNLSTILIKIADCIYITIPMGLSTISTIQNQLTVATHLTYIDNDVRLVNENEEIGWWAGAIIYMTDVELSSLLLEQLNTKEF